MQKLTSTPLDNSGDSILNSGTAGTFVVRVMPTLDKPNFIDKLERLTGHSIAPKRS
jgi:hypothetical protein